MIEATMTDALGNEVKLRPGVMIRVKFGRSGSQSAIVKKVTCAGNVHVSKYQKKSKHWTNPIRLYEGELLGLGI